MDALIKESSVDVYFVNLTEVSVVFLGYLIE